MMMPDGGVFGVGKEDGEFPSLADTIAAVRRDLSAAQTAGLGQVAGIVQEGSYETVY